MASEAGVLSIRPSLRRTAAQSRCIGALEAISRVASPDELDRVAANLEAAAAAGQGSARGSAEGRLAQRLGVARSRSVGARVDAETKAMARYFALRASLLEGALSAPQVAALLGTSRQTPHDRQKAGTLLAVRDKGVLRFPAWQFDPNGPHGVVEGFAQALRTLDLSPLSAAAWFTRNQAALGRLTPIQALRNGQAAQVVALAASVGIR